MHMDNKVELTTSARYCCPAFLPCRLALPLLLLLLPSLSLLRPQTRLSRHPAQLPLAQSSARDRQARVTLGLVYPKIAEPLNQQESGRRHHPCHSIYLTRCVWGKKMLRTKNSSSSQSQESNKSQTPRDHTCMRTTTTTEEKPHETFRSPKTQSHPSSRELPSSPETRIRSHIHDDAMPLPRPRYKPHIKSMCNQSQKKVWRRRSSWIGARAREDWRAGLRSAYVHVESWYWYLHVKKAVLVVGE
jgi:hypothetical protein